VRELAFPRALPIALAHRKLHFGVSDASRAARPPRLLRLSARESCCKRCKFAVMGFVHHPACFLRLSYRTTALKACEDATSSSRAFIPSPLPAPLPQ